MEYFEALTAMNLVPAAWWTALGRWMAYTLVAMVAVNGLLWLLDREDMRDGKRDLAWVPAWRASFVLMLSFAQALLEMLPVQVPIVRGLERLRDIKRAKDADAKESETKVDQ